MRLNFFVILLGLSLVGCNRSTGNHSTLKFKIAAKSVNALTAYPPQIVIINVSGSGITRPIVFECENRENGSTCPADGSVVIDNVPRGTDRLIQALLVYKNTATGGMIFFYGDVTKSLSLSSESVSLAPSQIGSSTLEGNVSGRYLNDSESGGPTGLLEASFVPPNGRPPMIVMRGAMISGWFNLFLLDDVDFNYTLNGQPLFTNVRLSSPAFAASNRVARYSVPAHFRARTDNTSVTYEPEAARIAIVGYFGTPPTGVNPVSCYDDSAAGSEIPDLFGATGTLGQNPLTWMGADTSQPNSVYRIAGGLDYSDPACSPDTEFSSALSFYWDQLRNGNDSTSGFRAPFRYMSMEPYGLNYSEASISSGTLTLNWKYLPGTTLGATGIKGTDIFMTSTPPSHPEALYADGGIKCSALTQPEFGFQLKASIPVDANFPDDGAAEISGVTGNEFAVICPYIVVNGTKKLLDVGMEVWGMGGDGGGGVFTPGVTDMQIRGPEFNGSANWSDNTCVPFEVAAMNNGMPTTFSQNTTFNLSISGAAGDFYADDFCNNKISGSFNLPYYSDRVRFAFKGSGTNSSTSATLTATSAAPNLNPISKTYSLTLRPLPTPLPTTYQLMIRAPSSTFAYQCNSVSLESWYDVNGTSFFIAPPTGAYLNWPTLAGLQFYPEYDWNCQQASVDYPYLNADKPIHRARFKYSGQATSISLAPTATTPFGSVIGVTSVSISQPGPIARMSLMLPNFIEEGQCTPMIVELQDSAGHPAPAGANGVALTLNPGGGVFYTDAACSTGGSVASATIPANQTQIVRYYMHLSAGTTTSVSVSATTPALSATVQVNVENPTANKLVVILPGETFTNGVRSGTPNPQVVNTSFNVVVYALNYKGQVDLNYNSNIYTDLDGTGLRQVGTIVNGIGSFMTSRNSIGSYPLFIESHTVDWRVISGSSSILTVNAVP